MGHRLHAVETRSVASRAVNLRPRLRLQSRSDGAMIAPIARPPAGANGNNCIDRPDGGARIGAIAGSVTREDER
jgi:hypothetical protein